MCSEQAMETEAEDIRFILHSVKLLLECGETAHALQLINAYLELLDADDPEN